MRWLILVPLMSGCSFIRVTPTPTVEARSRQATCAGPGWLVADGIGTALGLAGGLAVKGIIEGVNSSCNGNATGGSCSSTTAGWFIPAAIFGASLIYGSVAEMVCQRRLTAGEINGWSGAPAPVQPDPAR